MPHQSRQRVVWQISGPILQITRNKLKLLRITFNNPEWVYLSVSWKKTYPDESKPNKSFFITVSEKTRHFYLENARGNVVGVYSLFINKFFYWIICKQIVHAVSKQVLTTPRRSQRSPKNVRQLDTLYCNYVLHLNLYTRISY